MPTPDLVTLDVWGVPRRAVPAAVLRMATDRRRMRRSPGLLFGKLLGTGSGETFTVRDADARHWALLTVWADAADRRRFDDSGTVRGWNRLAEEHWRADLRPISSRGSWSRQQPFGEPLPTRWDGPIAAITRARLVPAQALTFWRAVPPVSADLHTVAGMSFALGVGEAPLGLQGTFSVWQDAAALTEFAYRRGPHTAVVEQTASRGWYAEELFARFAVLSAGGSYRGRDPLA